MLAICVLLLCANVLLGGATGPGSISDAALQLVSIPALVMVLFNWQRLPLSTAGLKPALALCVAIVGVPLLQLIPLPASVVSVIEPNAFVTEVMQLAHLELPYRTLSVAPYATALSALSLLPPVTLFLAVQTLSAEQRKALNLMLLVLCFTSIVLGLLQLASGPASSLRPYAVTNDEDAVGFFANRNHLAALIYCALVYLLAWLPDNPDNEAAAPKKNIAAGGMRLPDPLISTLVALGTFVLIAAEATTRSRTGILLALLALGIAGLALIPSLRSLWSGRTFRLVAVGAATFVVLFMFEFAAYRSVQRFTFDPRADGRIPYVRNTIAAAKAFLPFGSGVGTFTTVYPRFPTHREETIGVHANRAHSDITELFLEAGVLYLAVAAGFLAWLASRIRALWAANATDSRTTVAQKGSSLEKASTLVLGLLILHSFVDYPLRTGAMLAIFAYACATIIPAPRMERGSVRRSQRTRGQTRIVPAGRPALLRQ